MHQSINIEWFAEDENGEVKESHENALKERALERIYALLKEGYLAGEIIENIRTDDEDGEDGVQYNGWFSLAKETVTDTKQCQEKSRLYQHDYRTGE